MTKVGSAGKTREARADITDRESRHFITQEQNAHRAKTARLRAERLAREAAEKPAPAKPKAKPKAKASQPKAAPKPKAVPKTKAASPKGRAK
jgi:hypothetical protein